MTTSHSRSARPSRIVAALLGVVLGACADPPAALRLPEPGDLTSLAKSSGGGGSNALQVVVSGLPAGVPAAGQVTGPRGFATPVTGTVQLSGLADGNYTISASRVVSGGSAWDPTPTSQTVSLRKGVSASRSITYAVAPTTGSLAITISIPESTPVPVTVTGPNGYSQAVSSTQTLSSLAPGTYTVSASNFTAPGGVSYVSSPATQTASVVAGATTSRSVTYTPTSVAPGDLNLQILGAMLTQSVQSLGNDVALISGRNAMLRVFAVANGTNTVQPKVRARIYRNGSLVATYTANAPGASVPTSLDANSAVTSWNIPVPASQVQGGLSIAADVDPDGAVAEAVESDNAWPSSGVPHAFNVRTVPPLSIRLVPVQQNQLTGTIIDTVAFLNMTRDMFPLQTVTWTPRATYTSSTVLSSDGTGWSALLSELYALRSADGSQSHYYGVVRVGYGSGVAGIGYIGAPASLGWDYASSGPETMAHEFGHNWGRQHVGCGGPANPDPNYPYTGGVIGVTGFNVRTGAFIASSTPDLMGYCRPRWISDYTYNAVLNYRGSSAASTSTTTTSVQPGLLVWGRISAGGDITLEPAVRVVARGDTPRRGPWVVEALDASDNTLATLDFTPQTVIDERGRLEQHFSLILPMSDAAQARLATLNVAGFGRVATRTSASNGAALQALADAAGADDAGGGRVRMRWNASAAGAPLALVRDAQSGDIVAMARGGDVTIAARGADLDVTFSDGVRSATRRVRVRGR